MVWLGVACFAFDNMTFYLGCHAYDRFGVCTGLLGQRKGPAKELASAAARRFPAWRGLPGPSSHTVLFLTTFR